MIEWSELQRRQQDWLEVSPDAMRWRRQILKWATNRDHEMFAHAIERVRAGQEKLIIKYAPGLMLQLDRDSSVATTPDLHRLLELAVKRHVGQRPDLHRWFDAVSLFDQALGVAQLEKNDPLELVGKSIATLIDFLGHELFQGAFESTEFYVYHDPERDFIVGPDDVGIGRRLSQRADGRTQRKVRLVCRRAIDDGLVFLHHRIKEPYQVWLKMLRQVAEGKVKNPYEISDRCGLMFVVETREQIPMLADRILSLLQRNGGIVTEPLEANFAIDRPTDATNAASSSSYKVAKMRVCWKDRQYELQFIAFYDYFNSTSSLSDANHELYKLRQARRFSFPVLWPSSIYEIEWDSPHVRHLMRFWKTALLGWQVDGVANAARHLS